MTDNCHSWTLEALKSALLALAVAGFLAIELRWVEGIEFLLLPQRWWIVLAACASPFLLYDYKKGKLSPFSLSAAISLYLVIFYGSDLRERVGSYLRASPVTGDIFVFGLIPFLLCVLFRRGLVVLRPWMLLLVVQFLVLGAFLISADNRLIFSDDHPSFLYRIQLLLKSFPNFVVYTPGWNAGYYASELPVVGVIGFLALTFPLFLFSGASTPEAAAVYTTALGFVFIVLVPQFLALAARVLRFSPWAAFLAGLFALAPSVAYFRWVLHYGTIGFALAAGILPLVFALSYRVFFDEERPAWWQVILLVFSALIMFSWPLSGLTLLPLALLVLPRVKSLMEPERRAKTLACLLLLFVAESPFLYSILYNSKATSIVAAVSEEAHPEEDKIDNVAPGLNKIQQQEAGLRNRLRLAVIRMNPLLPIFLPFSLFMLWRTRLGYVATTICAWLFALALFGDAIKPQLEFVRFFVFLSFLAALIAPLSIGSLMGKHLKLEGLSPIQHAASLFFIYLLSLGVSLAPVHALAAYTNHVDDEHFRYAPKELTQLSDAIREQVTTGRVFFSGFILHDFGASAYDLQDGGHIAPLATFSGRELYAFHFYHVFWRGVDPVPKEFLDRDEEGVEEFLDLINASAMVTFNRVWRKYCEKNPKYRLVGRAGRFRLFSRTASASGYFLKGSGQVTPLHDGVAFVPEQHEVVLKYRYHPRLKARIPGVELFPVPVFKEEGVAGNLEQVSFLGVRLNGVLPGTKIEIR